MIYCFAGFFHGIELVIENHGNINGICIEYSIGRQGAIESKYRQYVHNINLKLRKYCL